MLKTITTTKRTNNNKKPMNCTECTFPYVRMLPPRITGSERALLESLSSSLRPRAQSYYLRSPYAYQVSNTPSAEMLISGIYDSTQFACDPGEFAFFLLCCVFVFNFTCLLFLCMCVAWFSCPACTTAKHSAMSTPNRLYTLIIQQSTTRIFTV